MCSQIRFHKTSIFLHGLLLFAFLLIGANASAAEPGIVNLQLVNASTQLPVAGVQVTAYRRDGDKLRWTQRRTTDTDGKANFELKNLDSGSQYVFKANPFNSGNVYSEAVTQAGSFEFSVGTSRIDVRRGADDSPLVNHKITVYKRLEDGKRKWNRSGSTDSEGTLFVDLPDMESGATYFLRTKSPFDNRTKESGDITSPGPITFTVGNRLLNVKLKNGVDGNVLPDTLVRVYEVLENGSLKGRQERTTDNNGQADFDLPGLGSGRAYQLRTKPYNTGWVWSSKITQPGAFDFNVGTFEVKVIRGSDDGVLAKQKITAYRLLENGDRKWYASGETDSNGIIRFDLPGLGSGAKYFLRTRSPFDKRTKDSDALSEAGRFTFTVGNRLLNVSLLNDISGDPLANIKIRAYEILEDGSLKGRQEGTTGEQGQISFDLPGLGTGRAYRLRTRPYNSGWVTSQAIKETGPFAFRVGTFEVKAITGVDDSILVDHKITAYKRLDNGERKWYRSGTTDKNGIVRFDLEGLGSGTKYLLIAKSPFDGRTKTSEDIAEAGQYTFTIGNRLLNVTLQNDVSKAPLANTKVNAYQILEDGSRTGWREGTTDENGRVDFDLPGLGKGRNYQLRTKPYNTGSVKSSVISETGPFIFSVGTVPVTLRHADKNEVLPDQKITLYQKQGNGKLKWRASGTSDALGIVHFDPPGFDAGQVYIARAHNLFGQNKRYFSAWILQAGAVDFAVRPGENTSPDLTPPSLTITDPSEGSNVSNAGFTLRGRANDDRELAGVNVSIENAGVTNSPAKYENGFWEFPVSESMLTANEKVVLTVQATDTAKNSIEVTRTLEVIIDKESPTLTITSHQNGDEVVDSGFLVSGIATDNVSVSELLATVQNSADGVIIDQQPVEIANSSGRWALAIGAVSSGNPVQVTLSASDIAGNSVTETVSLDVVSVPINAVQLINRTTFGATPDLLDEVRRVGPVAYLDEQLNPQSIDDSSFESRLASLGEPDSARDLQDYQLLRAIYSKRQLLEVMTWFWDNHFNTDINKSRRVSYELDENQKFRANAFGRFRDLLEISVSSPAMLIYLDNATSHKDDPNENHSREALELHSMGDTGAYTPQDIVELARILTGWRVRNRQFYFDPRYHDNGEKIFLGEIIPAGSGMSGGLQALDIIATHSSTADFICGKLIQLFVSDHPSQALVDDCAAAYFANYDEADQIGRMVELIIRSPEFNAADQLHSKVKTPLEFVAGIIRNLNAVGSTRYSRDALSDMGMHLFRNPVPTGWAEVGPGWVNSNQMLQRIQHSSAVVFNRARERLTHLNNVVGFFRNREFETSEGIVGYLFNLLMANDYSQLEWDKAVGVLTNGGTVPFDINDDDAERRLRTLIAMMLSYPSYQLQ